jgi:hypothetical protein
VLCLFDCLFVCFVLATAEAFFSLDALRSRRGGGGGVALLVEGEGEREREREGFSCAIVFVRALRSRVGRSVALFSREQTAQGGG